MDYKGSTCRSVLPLNPTAGATFMITSHWWSLLTGESLSVCVAAAESASLHSFSTFPQAGLLNLIRFTAPICAGSFHFVGSTQSSFRHRLSKIGLALRRTEHCAQLLPLYFFSYLLGGIFLSRQTGGWSLICVCSRRQLVCRSTVNSAFFPVASPLLLNYDGMNPETTTCFNKTSAG